MKALKPNHLIVLWARWQLNKSVLKTVRLPLWKYKVSVIS